MEPGLAALLQRKVGYAWRPIIDQMYRQINVCQPESSPFGMRSFARTAQ
jgi:hypothetical protein